MAIQNYKDSTLWNADNLDVLRGINSATVDLVYLDPPFNSNRMYQAAPGTKAQGQSFDDTWSWNSAKEEWLDTLQDDYPAVYEAIEAARDCNRPAMGGYIAFMAVRLIEIHRVLKPTGAMYLHCDWFANSYLRTVCDAIFGWTNLKNELIWMRAYGKNGASKKFSQDTDTILFYVKSNAAKFQPQYKPHRPEYIKAYNKDDGDGKGPYQITDTSAPADNPNGKFQWMGYDHPAKGWRYSRETMQKHHDNGRLWYPDDKKQRIRFKSYLSESKGRMVPSIWTDIDGLSPWSKEYKGWATQKPVGLLERIFNASTQPGDLILDPFCGCATAMVAAQGMGRRWIGIDKEPYAIDQVRERLGLWCNFETEPPIRTDGDATDMRSIPVRLQRDPYGWEKFTNNDKRVLLADIQAKDEGVQCPGCGIVLPVRYFHLDHDRPKSDPRSSNMIDNRILLCAPCNGQKGNQMTMQGLLQHNSIEKWLAPGVERKELERLLENVSVEVENLKARYP